MPASFIKPLVNFSSGSLQGAVEKTGRAYTAITDLGHPYYRVEGSGVSKETAIERLREKVAELRTPLRVVVDAERKLAQRDVERVDALLAEIEEAAKTSLCKPQGEQK
jgi:hypothetical protein